MEGWKPTHIWLQHSVCIITMFCAMHSICDPNNMYCELGKKANTYTTHYFGNDQV